MLSDAAKQLLEDWKKSSNNLVAQLEDESDRDLLLYSNIVQVPERERETARTLLNIRLSERQQILLSRLEAAVNNFNKSSTRISIAMCIIGLATFIATIKSWLR